MKDETFTPARFIRGGSAMISTALIGNMRGYLQSRSAVRGLLRLSDRDLEDLRLTRAELALIARRYFCS